MQLFSHRSHVRNIVHQAGPLATRSRWSTCHTMAASTVLQPKEAKRGTQQTNTTQVSGWHQEVSELQPGPCPDPPARNPSTQQQCHVANVRQQQLEQAYSWHDLGELPEEIIAGAAPGVPPCVQMLQAALEFRGEPLSASELERLSNPSNVLELHDLVLQELRRRYFHHKQQLTDGERCGSPDLQQLQQQYDTAAQHLWEARIEYQGTAQAVEDYRRVRAAANAAMQRINNAWSMPQGTIRGYRKVKCLGQNTASIKLHLATPPPVLVLRRRPPLRLIGPARKRSHQQQHSPDKSKQQLLEEEFCFRDLGECPDTFLADVAPGIPACIQKVQAALESINKPLTVSELERLRAPGNIWELQDLVVQELRRRYYCHKQRLEEGKSSLAPGSSELQQLQHQYDTATQSLQEARLQYDSAATAVQQYRRARAFAKSCGGRI